MPHTTLTARKHRSPAQWAELFARFEQSSLTVSAFCARESISVANFYRQRGLLGACAPAKRLVPREPSKFVDLGAINGGVGERSRLELKIDLGEGLILHLVRG